MATEGLLQGMDERCDPEKTHVGFEMEPATATLTRCMEQGIWTSVWTTQKRVWWSVWFNFSCGVVVTLLFIAILCPGQKISKISPRAHAVTKPGESYTPDDLASLTHQRLFMKNYRFDPDERNGLTEAAWAELYERYVRIDRPERFGLRPSEPHPIRPVSEAYAIAGFHQTHCLTTIRYGWYLATAPTGAPPAYRPTNLQEGVTLEELEEHMKHCFDYLRQSIQCCADSTLEPFVQSDGITPQPHGSSGYGVVHKCRNYQGLADWVEEHKLTDFDPPEDAQRRKSWPLNMSLIEEQ